MWPGHEGDFSKNRPFMFGRCASVSTATRHEVPGYVPCDALCQWRPGLSWEGGALVYFSAKLGVMDGTRGICSGLSPSKVISGVCSPQGLSLWASPRNLPLAEARGTHGMGTTKHQCSFSAISGGGGGKQLYPR